METFTITVHDKEHRLRASKTVRGVYEPKDSLLAALTDLPVGWQVTVTNWGVKEKGKS